MNQYLCRHPAKHSNDLTRVVWLWDKDRTLGKITCMGFPHPGRNLAAVSTLDAALVDLKLNGSPAEDVADILSQRNIPFCLCDGLSAVSERTLPQGAK